MSNLYYYNRDSDYPIENFMGEVVHPSMLTRYGEQFKKGAENDKNAPKIESFLRGYKEYVIKRANGASARSLNKTLRDGAFKAI